MRQLLMVAVVTFATFASAADEPARKLPIGSAAPKLDVRLLDGSAAPSWRGLRGKVVVLDFWASWCGPCVGAIPHLDALKKELAGAPVEFYSITYEPKAKATAFLAKHPMQTVVGLDNDLATFTSLIAWGIPMAYVIDGNGKIAAVVYPPKLTAAAIWAVLAGKVPEIEQHSGWNDPAGAAKYFREQLVKDRAAFGND
jgi:thiol-disulfide isomerase/thioredoxin